MATDTPELQIIFRRIERLERENRQLKPAVLAIAVLAVIVFGMAQAKPRARTVEAEEFVLTDEHGLKRANLGNVGGPGLAIYDTHGRTRILLALNEDGPFLHLNAADSKEGPDVAIRPGFVAIERDGVTLNLAAAYNGPSLTLLDPHQGGVILDKDGLSVESAHGSADLGVGKGEPNLRLSDEEGFSTIVGSTNLVTPNTGEKHKTSAASLILFDKDNKILWRAP